MKGIIFHWESPWVDIYSGLDPMASAWRSLGRAFDLRLVAVECGWPFPDSGEVEAVRSEEEALELVASDRVVAASPYGDRYLDLQDFDWLLLGPANGWGGRPPNLPLWAYWPTPPGGYHALHLAHIAAHLLRG